MPKEMQLNRDKWCDKDLLYHAVALVLRFAQPPNNKAATGDFVLQVERKHLAPVEAERGSENSMTQLMNDPEKHARLKRT